MTWTWEWTTVAVAAIFVVFAAGLLGLAVWVWRDPPPHTADEIDAVLADLVPDDRPVVLPAVRPDSITCPRCDMTSYNPNDIAQGFCGRCNDWTSPPRRPTPHEQAATSTCPPRWRRPAPPPHRSHGTPRYHDDPPPPEGPTT